MLGSRKEIQPLANIFYGMCGEGRGHATRARAVVESLRAANHKITLFASDCAHALLAPIYRDTEVRVVTIPGLRFSYSAPGRVALVDTFVQGLRYRFSVGDFVRAVLPEFERGKPDLVIADFEPILPRAARKCGVPFVSFDHQHYLVVSDFGQLPFRLRHEAALAAPCVRALYDWQIDTIVSSFYEPPLKRRWRHASQVGVLIRPELLHLSPDHGRHLVAYMRRHASPQLLSTLAGCGREVRIYGLGKHEARGNLRFLPVDEARFIDDLATAAAVVSGAGNQLVGEAFHLGKPVLAMPERRNFEQSVNAYFLEQSGAGWIERGELAPARLGAFLERVPELRARIDRAAACGNAAAAAALGRHLGGSLAPVAAPGLLAPVPARKPARAVGAQWA
jgi:uncharacterized protein (TIGR00661 family)